MYGPAKRRLKNEFWEELDGLPSFRLQAWILVGDFNVVRWRSESNASSIAKDIMNTLDSFILRTNLIDPSLPNNLYTWSNLIVNPICSRLDPSYILPYGKILTKLTIQEPSFRLPWNVLTFGGGLPLLG